MANAFVPEAKGSPVGLTRSAKDALAFTDVRKFTDVCEALYEDGKV
jgi:hypothetical protein